MGWEMEDQRRIWDELDGERKVEKRKQNEKNVCGERKKKKMKEKK